MVNAKDRPKTIFLDLDGCIVKQNSTVGGYLNFKSFGAQILSGVKDKLFEWNFKGYKIIITTGRPEAYRSMTEGELRAFGVPYDMLIMGLPTGRRVLINDLKPGDDYKMAVAYNLVRNTGLTDIEE